LIHPASTVSILAAEARDAEPRSAPSSIYETLHGIRNLLASLPAIL